jgi:hypothetical protein
MRKTAITVAKEWKKERKKYNLFDVWNEKPL